MKNGLESRMRVALAEQCCARTTVATYLFWAAHLYRFTGKPASQWSGSDVQAWLWSLHKANYSAVSRKQALCAAAFVFKHVLKADMGRLQLPPLPVVHRPLKTIPTRTEIGRMAAGIRGPVKLMIGLMYGSGLRVSECCRLRVQDIDLDRLLVKVHAGKGDKSRLTVLPAALVPSLQRHLAWRAALHECDLANGQGLVELPGRLAIKYKSAARELRWQWLFPSTILRGQYRWHTTDEAIAKQMRAAVRAAGITTRITPHTLRHAFASDALRAGNDIKTVQDWLGHADLNTTAIYLHTGHGQSPLDAAPLPASPRLRVSVVPSAPPALAEVTP